MLGPRYGKCSPWQSCRTRRSFDKWSPPVTPPPLRPVVRAWRKRPRVEATPWLQPSPATPRPARRNRRRKLPSAPTHMRRRQCFSAPSSVIPRVVVVSCLHANHLVCRNSACRWRLLARRRATRRPYDARMVIISRHRAHRDLSSEDHPSQGDLVMARDRIYETRHCASSTHYWVGGCGPGAGASVLKAIEKQKMLLV